MAYTIDTPWQTQLIVLVTDTFEETDERKAALARRDALIERVRELDQGLAREVGGACSDQVLDAVEYGGALGYALARCWPDSVEGLADWPDQAAELAAAIQRRSKPAKNAPGAA